jgi:hypothetical protein
MNLECPVCNPEYPEPQQPLVVVDCAACGYHAFTMMAAYECRTLKPHERTQVSEGLARTPRTDPPHDVIVRDIRLLCDRPVELP